MLNKYRNRSTGNEGENIAAQYLVQKGYKIVDRNINFSFGEIDILAQLRDQIIIVEVKTVRGRGFGLAQDLVRFAKQKKLRLLAGAIAQLYPGKSLRIDVVGIDLSEPGPLIEHLENAVEG